MVVSTEKRAGIAPRNAACQLLRLWVMKSLARALWVWLILGGLSWSLATGGKGDLIGPAAGGVLLLLLSAAIWLTAIAEKGDRHGSYGRAVISSTTLLAWLVALLIVQGRIERHPEEKETLLATLCLALVIAASAVVKTRSYPRWSALRPIAITLAIPIVIGSAFLWSYEAKTRSIAARAETRWSEIGMPLAEFEKTLAASHENAGSEIFRRVLREETGSSFYKVGTYGAAKEPKIENSQTADSLVRQAIDLFVDTPPQDDIDISARKTDVLEAMSSTLDTNYRQILAAEPPTWNMDPHEGYNFHMPTWDTLESYDSNLPNFLGIRKFAQVTAGDALRRFALGDQEGAARALSAGLYVRAGLRQRPSVISLMISIAVEALLSEKRVRLPASPEDGFPAIARDTEMYRAEFFRSLQDEAWTALRFSDQIADIWRESSRPRWGFLPRWATLAVLRPMARREAAAAALNDAEHVASLKSPATLSSPDFGFSEQEAISNANPSTLECNVTRAMMRIYVTLLLREQTELIRNARARLAAGQLPKGRVSVVLPFTRWELATNAEKNSVTTRLANAPEWIVKGEVAPTAFWVIPLDGSAAWKFHQPAQTTNR